MRQTCFGNIDEVFIILYEARTLIWHPSTDHPGVAVGAVAGTDAVSVIAAEYQVPDAAGYGKGQEAKFNAHDCGKAAEIDGKL